jgi:hypothetical protein
MENILVPNYTAPHPGRQQFLTLGINAPLFLQKKSGKVILNIAIFILIITKMKM